MLPDHITVRLAVSADAAEIAAMSRDLIEAGLGWTWTRARVARAIADNDTVALTARDTERLIGFALMYFGEEHAHLSLLAVRPQYQRAGIGRHLVAWLVESGLAAGVAAIRLELRASNRAARRFYERLGFNVTSRVPGYYGGIEPALRMTRDIRRGPRGPVPEWRHLLRG
jgi:ribosomal protein S18 acetylase RimI-like enzyme